MAVTSELLLSRMFDRPPVRRGDWHTLSFPGMGTENRIQFRAPDARMAEDFEACALGWLARFEADYSVFLADSLLSRINREAGRGWVDIDPETERILAVCDRLFALTRGAVDPTAGPLIALWDYHRTGAQPPGEAALAAARERVGWRMVEREPGRVRFLRDGMRLDLGGVGKEHAVDHVAGLAAAAGISDCLVDLGRDVRAFGLSPGGGAWRLGLEHPDAPGKCWGGIGLNHAALCCSGDYRRYFEHAGKRYGHILDPRDGQPVRNGCRAAWVIAPTATDAGALTTASMVLGFEEGLRLIGETPGAAGCIWHHDNLHQTGGFSHHVLR